MGFMDKIKSVDWSPSAGSIREQRAAVKAGSTAKDANRKTMHAAGDSKIVCPQCQTAGHVTTRRVKAKKGISGGKATGAVLTAGFSILATGLSRKELVTQAACANCRSLWTF
jgi:hypothetical protein